MGTINEIMQSVIDEVHIKTSDPQRQKEIVDRVFSETLPEITETLIASLNDNTHYMLSEHRFTDLEFRARLNRRWFEAFDLLEKCVVSSLEIGEELQKNSGKIVTEDNKQLLDVLLRLHARGIQIAKEILVLMRNGFADGALARWRTLYEISITSLFIAKHGNELATRYKEYSSVETYGELNTYLKKNEKLRFQKVSSAEVERQKQTIKELEDKYGRDFMKRYGWTASVLEKSKRNFEGIEENVENDHLRPFYKWACNAIHAGPKAAYYRIGVLGQTNLMLAGPTNYAFADPGQNTALAVLQITSSLGSKFYGF